MNKKTARYLSLLLLFTSHFLLAIHSSLNQSEFEEIVHSWNAAHNDWKFAELKKLYASKVLYYTKWQTRDFCISNKLRQVSPNKEFQQKITTQIKTKSLRENLVVCSFVKSVRTGNKLKDYPAYLVLKQVRNSWQIVAESDEITDRNRNFVLSASVFESKTYQKKQNSKSSRKGNYDFLLYSFTSLAAIILVVLAARKWRNRQQLKREVPPISYPQTVPEEIKQDPEQTLSNKEKGNLFENFIINKFDKNYFTLLDRTNDTVTNGIHALSRSNPDFLYQFELRGYVKKFAVECTYCSNVSSLIDIKLPEQIARYKKYGEEQKVDVYILFGLGGSPQSPKELFIIPLEKAKPKMSYDELKMYGRSNINRLYLNRDTGLLT